MTAGVMLIFMAYVSSVWNDKTDACGFLSRNLQVALLVPVVLCLPFMSHFLRNDMEHELARKYKIAGEVSFSGDSTLILGSVIVAAIATFWVCMDSFKHMNADALFTLFLLDTLTCPTCLEIANTRSFMKLKM
jgi:hypothetical protein